MNKRKLILGLGAGLIFTSIVSGVLASVAWFYINNNVNLQVTGSFVEAYFHTGTGTENDPFVITRPIHYYHLVEFYQRTTTLPSPSVHFGSEYLYFQVGYNLDNDSSTLEVYEYDDQGLPTGEICQTLNMAYYSGTNALMPIGTNEVPFIGYFDGKADKDIVISNLNIHCAETVKVGNNSVNRAASDIGVFGYISDDDGSGNSTVIANTKIDGLTIDLTGVSSTVKSTDQGLPTDHTNDNEHAGVAYVGYIAGHVHSYTNYSSSGPTNASPLYDVYVDNATIKGGAGTVCNYGYIGLVDTIDGENTTESVEDMISTLNDQSGGTIGDEWGGSMNFQDFNRRIKAQLSNASAVTYQQNPTSRPDSTSTDYQRMRSFENSYLSASVYYGSNIMSNIVNKNPDTTRVIYNYLDEGNYTRSSYNQVSNIPGTVQPLITAENNYFAPHDDNTGYIIGGVANKNYTGSNYGMTVRTASYESRFIANALGDTTFSSANINSGTDNGRPNGNTISFPAYDKTKLEILTNSSNTYGASNYCFIKDELAGYNQGHTPNYNYTKSDSTTPTALNLTKYNDSRESLHDILNGQSFIHGLHFVGSSVTYDNYVTRSNLRILGGTKNNYKLPKNSIDFNLKEAGKINFFAGSYYSRGTPSNNTSTVPNPYTADSDNFFSLYHIIRSGDDLVSTSVKKISVIYENTNAEVDAKYVYQYSDNSNSSGTKGTKLFDLAYMDHCPVANALYYFEIPVDGGEYALGAANSSTSSYGGYLMYLDIGTSGEQQAPTFDQENMIQDVPLFTQIGFLESSGSFMMYNSCFNIAYIIPAGATKDNFSVKVSCTTETITGDDYICYDIVIINTSGNTLTLNALLMEDDDEDDENYFYMYSITYNTGSRTLYHRSDTYEGLTGGTSMTPTYNTGGGSQ